MDYMKTSAGVKVLVLSFCALVVMALTVGAAQATTFTWNFSSPSGDVGPTQTYTSTPGSITIDASGWSTSSAFTSGTSWQLSSPVATDLFGKNAGLGETGLGLASFADTEIVPATLVQLDLLNLQSANLKNLTMTIGSLQTGEAFAVFNSDTAAANLATGTLLQEGTGGGTLTFTIPGLISNLDRYVWITAISGNVLLDDGLSATTSVPEPATLLMIGLGLVGLAGIRRKIKN
jgi:hypothetical protein